ncbi:MAG: hypothetical protein KAJ12_09130 [Bacteroidetes bacterium]|nr:hypothetical protein [Bacteroidota bacterium]
MPATALHRQIARKGSDKKKIARTVLTNPELVDDLVQGLGAGAARVKYGCSKVLLLVSEKEPRIIYPRIDLFFDLLDSENNILRWTAIQVIANLASVDEGGKIEKHFDLYFAPIAGPVLITAANVIGGAAKIALAKPNLVEKITRELLRVEKASYQTAECRRIALGQTVKSLGCFFDRIVDKEPVVKLVRKQLRSSRGGTREAAERFMQTWLRAKPART